MASNHWIAALLLVSGCTLSNPAYALAEGRLSDLELAQKEVIVVAHWARAPLVPHDDIQRNGSQHREIHTELIIERVIRGDVQPGPARLQIEAGADWRPDGTREWGDDIPFLLDPIDNVNTSNVWFLSRGRSWDPGVTSNYLRLETKQAIRPLWTEPLFRVLAADDRRARIRECLGSRDVRLVSAALDFVAGNRMPWPYGGIWEDSWTFGAPATTDTVGEQLGEVQKLVDGGPRQIRAYAAAILALLEGPASYPRMRSLLQDRDPEVRMVAAGVLISERDIGSLDRIHRVIRRQNPEVETMEALIVRSLGEWNDLRIVPLLLDCLSWFDSLRPPVVGRWRPPVLRAQESLRERTGFTFPQDSAASRMAWEATRAESDVMRRNTRLRALLGEWLHPLSVRVWQHDREVVIRLRNESGKTLHLQDCMVEFSGDDHGQSVGGSNFPGSTAGRLAPGDEVRFRLILPDWANHVPAGTRWTLTFADPIGPRGVRAWIGTVSTGAADVDTSGRR